MPEKRKAIDVLEATKDDGLKVLSDTFPPGTSAWAFWNALLVHSLSEFKAGKLTILGVTARGSGKANQPQS